MLVFGFNREIIQAAINYHGNNVVSISELLFSKMGDDMTPVRFEIIGDNAFSVGNRISCGKVLHERKANELQELMASKEMTATDFLMQRLLSSKRLAAE